MEISESISGPGCGADIGLVFNCYFVWVSTKLWRGNSFPFQLPLCGLPLSSLERDTFPLPTRPAGAGLLSFADNLEGTGPFQLVRLRANSSLWGQRRTEGICGCVFVWVSVEQVLLGELCERGIRLRRQ